MLDINDFEKTGEYRDVKAGEYFVSWFRGEPILCTISEKDKPRKILTPKEKTMRTKEEILEDGKISSYGMMSQLGLEVLIDIRDIFNSVLFELKDINFLLEVNDKGDNNV